MIKLFGGLIFTSVIFSLGCGSAKNHLFQEIGRLGYIPYKTALERSGTGTIIGGKPEEMSIVAAGSSCFPTTMETGEPSRLRHLDRTSLPKRRYRVRFSPELGGDLGAALGLPLIGGDINFEFVRTIELEMNDVHVEFLDGIRLIEFYEHSMSETCKDFLNDFAFVIQALKVGSMKFKFFDSTDNGIKIDEGRLKEIVSIGTEVKWSVESEYELVIATPRYMGYQLGRLRYEDEGKAIYRSYETKNGQYLFQKMTLFQIQGKSSPTPLELFDIPGVAMELGIE